MMKLMKYLNSRINKIVFTLLISAIVLLSGCSPMSELIRDETAGMNGSFEATKSGLPVNWLLYTPKTVKNSDFDLIIDSIVYKDGKQSLRFLVRSCSTIGGWHSPGFCKEFEAIPGASYVISFWVKNAGTLFSVIIGGVSVFDGKYDNIIKSSENLESWKYFKYAYTMPIGEKFNRIRFELNVLSAGSFWIDDIIIVGSDGKSVIPTSK
jgi:hypothetical protein